MERPCSAWVRRRAPAKEHPENPHRQVKNGSQRDLKTGSKWPKWAKLWSVTTHRPPKSCYGSLRAVNMVSQTADPPTPQKWDRAGRGTIHIIQRVQWEGVQLVTGGGGGRFLRERRSEPTPGHNPPPLGLVTQGPLVMKEGACTVHPLHCASRSFGGILGPPRGAGSWPWSRDVP